MTVEECCQRIGKRVAAGEGVAAVAEEIAALFGVESHEVAFFAVNAEKRSIAFRWPQTLSSGATIPLKAFDSLVARTANERHSFLDNDFSSTRHLKVLEHLLTEKADRIPVQKIMSVPVLSGESACGVVQVSRKGATRDVAGPDFTPEQLRDLETIAAALTGLSW